MSTISDVALRLGIVGIPLKMPDGEVVTEYVFPVWEGNAEGLGKLVLEIAPELPVVHTDFNSDSSVSKEFARRRCVERYLKEMSPKFYCPTCKDWILGKPTEERYDDIRCLSGTAGIIKRCIVCKNEVDRIVEAMS